MIRPYITIIESFSYLWAVSGNKKQLIRRSDFTFESGHFIAGGDKLTPLHAMVGVGLSQVPFEAFGLHMSSLPESNQATPMSIKVLFGYSNSISYILLQVIHDV